MIAQEEPGTGGTGVRLLLVAAMVGVLTVHTETWMNAVVTASTVYTALATLACSKEERT
ncbi:hypothetical protein [Streptomyces sp. SGAir0957]